MLMKITIKLDPISTKAAAKVKDEIALVTGNIVAEEFVKMLYDAPQYTGNFVANMAVAAGSTRGRKGGEIYFDQKITKSQAFSRGKLPAISKAISNNTGLQERMRASIRRSAGLWPAVTYYNNLPNAEEIEGLEPNELRPINSAGAHPLAKMTRALQVRFKERLVVGSPEWEYLVKRKVL
jgi:hypothetical protein